jgi:CRP-like cAMP-binding protein
MPTALSKLDRIQALPLFRACSRGELRLVARLAEVVQVGESAVVVREGRPGHEFFAIAEGTAEVVRDGRPVATLRPGDHFGELSILTRAVRDASVVSTTPMVLVVLEERAFRGLLAELPCFSRRILETLAVRLRGYDLDAQPS